MSRYHLIDTHAGGQVVREYSRLTPPVRTYSPRRRTKHSSWLERQLSTEIGRLVAMGLVCFIFGLGV